MPRNGSGIYSLPANSLAQTLTTIESAKYNAVLNDLVQDANSARPISAGGTAATTASGARAALGLGALAVLESMADLTDGDSWAAEVEVASVDTCDILGAAANFIEISGTTTITSFGTGTNKIRLVRFSGALTLTHDGTSLILPGATNITTAVGDTCLVISDGSSNARVFAYQRASGRALKALVAGGYKNLVVKVVSATAVDIDADAVTLENASGESYRATAVNLTAAITSAGANGLDTGAEASNTWYAVWVIYNPTTATLAGLLSTSATAPMLPDGYTFKVRVGWVRNDGSSNLYRTIQKGNRAAYVVGTNPTAGLKARSGSSGSVSSPTWTSTDITAYVPTATAATIILDAVIPEASDNSAIMAAPNDSYGSSTSGTNAPPLVIEAHTGGSGTVTISADAEMLLESTNIFYAANDSAADLYVRGWTDNL